MISFNCIFNGRKENNMAKKKNYIEVTSSRLGNIIVDELKKQGYVLKKEKNTNLTVQVTGVQEGFVYLKLFCFAFKLTESKEKGKN